MMLVAKKHFRYNSKKMQPGDVFEARHLVKALIGTGLAEKYVAPEPKKETKRGARKVQDVEGDFTINTDVDIPMENKKPSGKSSLDDLRMVAESLGVDIDRRWGRKKLEKEIAAKRKQYNTRMLRADE